MKPKPCGTLHLRSDTADIVRGLAEQTGMTKHEVTDILIRYAAARVKLVPVRVRYMIEFSNMEFPPDE